MVKSYSVSPLWTMIITIFHEKSNIYHISEPKISRFFPKLVPATSFTSVRSSFTLIHSALERNAAHLASFWRLFCSVMWPILVPFLSLTHFFFLSWFYNNYSGWVLNKTIILLGIAGYRIIITNSPLCTSLVIYLDVTANDRRWNSDFDWSWRLAL